MYAKLTEPGIAAFLFITLFLSGFRLSRAGSPYGGWRFAAHKLAGLALMLMLGGVLYRTGRQISVEVPAGAAAALCLLCAIITGSMITLIRNAPLLLKTAHRISVFLTIATTTIFFLLIMLRM